EVLEEPDVVGLAEAVEDGVVSDGQRRGGAVGHDAVGVVAGLESGVVDVVVLDQAGFDLDAGLEVGDVDLVDGQAAGVAVDVLDAGQDASGGGVGAHDGGVLDGDAAGVAEADAHRVHAAGDDLVVVQRHVARHDVDVVRDVQAGQAGAVAGDLHPPARVVG